MPTAMIRPTDQAKVNAQEKVEEAAMLMLLTLLMRRLQLLRLHKVRQGLFSQPSPLLLLRCLLVLLLQRAPTVLMVEVVAAIQSKELQGCLRPILVLGAALPACQRPTFQLHHWN